MAKRLILCAVLVALFSFSAWAAMTTSITSKPDAYWWSGATPNRDVAWQWAKEVEDRIESVTATGSFYFDPTDTEPDTDEGMTYYDDSENTLKFYTGSAWVAVESAAGNSLDASYNAGATIDVDGAAVTLTTSDTDDNAVLAIVQNEATNDNNGVTITMGTGATGRSLTIDSQSSGVDVKGDNWTVLQTGGLTCVGVVTTGELTVSAADVLFDATYDVAFDTNRNQFLFQDSAILGFGGAHDAVGDITVTFTTPNLIVEAETQDSGEVRVGSTDSLNWLFYGNTNTSKASFDSGAASLEMTSYDVDLDDGSDLIIGSGADWEIDSDTDKRLDAIPAVTTDDSIFAIGNATNTSDFYIYGKETSEGIFFDSSGAVWSFGFADNYGVDVVFYGDTTLQKAWWDCSTDSWFFGADAEGVDVTLYTDTTGQDLTLDESIHSLVSDDVDIKLDDDAILWFGLGTDLITADGDFSMNFTDGSPGYLTVTAVTAEDVFQIGDGSIATDVLIQNTTTATADIFWDDSGELWQFGVDNFGVDVKFFGDAASSYAIWDESIDTLVAVDSDIKLDDESEIHIGTKTNVTTADGDFKVAWVSDTRMDITAVVANSQVCIGDGTVATDFLIDNITTASADVWFDQSGDSANGILNVGVDDKGIDVKFFGETAGEYVWWDMTADTLAALCGNVTITTNDAEVDQVKINAVGAAAGNVVHLLTTDGGILVHANGGDNGDIGLDAADDMTLTAAGDLTLAVTGTFKMGNALVANERVSTVVDVDHRTLTAAESGSTVVFTMTGAAATCTLPEATANNIGMWFILVDGNITAARDLTIDPEGAGTINGDAAGESITCENDRDGEAVYIFSTAADTWYTVAMGSSTVWTEE